MIWFAAAVGITFLIFEHSIPSGALGLTLRTAELAIGIYLLIKGADLLIEGAVAVAERFGVSKLFIGLSLVAFGTSAPELAVSITAALKGYGGIAISNVVGSNVANILLCLGLTALFSVVNVGETTLKIEIPFLFLVTLSFSSMLLREGRFEILWNDGIVLLSFFVVFSYYLFKMAQGDMEVMEKVEEIDMKRAFLFLGIGLFGVSVGGDMTVSSVVKIASQLGLSGSLFALTVVAVGTSLPELVTSLTAALKGHHDLSVGNIVGSNIMNILVIIGISSIVGKDLDVDVPMYQVDISYLLGAVIILWLASIKGRIGREWGITFLALYTTFVSFVVMRG